MLRLLYACNQCEWIYSAPEKAKQCPYCGSNDTTSARGKYGPNAYSMKKTQVPWKLKKIAEYRDALDAVIKSSTKKKYNDQTKIVTIDDLLPSLKK